MGKIHKHTFDMLGVTVELVDAIKVPDLITGEVLYIAAVIASMVQGFWT